MAEGQLTFMRVPHDTMRDGLPGAKAGVTHLGKHPVEVIQEQVRFETLLLTRPSPAHVQP